MRSLLVLSLAFGLLISCSSNNSQQANDQAQITMNTKVVKCNISGMTCTGCENTIKNNVAKMEGIKSITASYLDSTAVVEYDTSVIALSEITQKINDLGYSVISVSEN